MCELICNKATKALRVHGHNSSSRSSRSVSGQRSCWLALGTSMLPSSAAPRPLAVAHEILYDDDDDDNDDGVMVLKASTPLAFTLAPGHSCSFMVLREQCMISLRSTASVCGNARFGTSPSCGRHGPACGSLCSSQLGMLLNSLSWAHPY
jgi:hypothetical protein